MLGTAGVVGQRVGPVAEDPGAAGLGAVHGDARVGLLHGAAGAQSLGSLASLGHRAGEREAAVRLTASLLARQLAGRRPVPGPGGRGQQRFEPDGQSVGHTEPDVRRAQRVLAQHVLQVGLTQEGCG